MEQDSARGPAADELKYGLADLQYTLQVYRERYNLLTAEIDELAASVASITSAQRTLDHAPSVSNHDVLMDIGGGAYSIVRSGSMKNVVIGIGAHVLVEMAVPEASETLKGRFDKQDTALKKLLNERKKAESAIYDLSYKIEEMSQTVG